MTGPGTAQSTILDIEGLSTGFGGNTVLHCLDFHVRRGEVAGLLGLNGAGKSVTMQVVAGLVPPWEGKVLLEGRDLSGLGPEERVEAGLGHVTQGRQVFPELTVEQNLRLGAYVVRRRNPSRYEPLLAEMYDRFPRLAERSDQLAGGMSGGEQAMLAVARALMSEPRLLLIDEPSAGLAPTIIGDLVELLRDVKKSGVTILLVEQNITFALQVADRVHVMQKGAIVHSGEVDTIDRSSLASHLGIGRLLSERLGVSTD
jgi:branched-chain amino acid transport system ATP-binding protein